MKLNNLQNLDPSGIDTPAIRQAIAQARRRLAELDALAKGVTAQETLIQALELQEAKDSSEIEGILTTHQGLVDRKDDANTRAVWRCQQAIERGTHDTQKSGMITVRGILGLHEVLESNDAGFRRLPGTEIKTGTGETVHTPPQGLEEIERLMADLEVFLNDETVFPADPLVKMALAHHQFESIHPFYDGNGRTGRILNTLYLIKEGLLQQPWLCFSGEILRQRDDYYRLLQIAREEDAWEDWVVHMLDTLERGANRTIALIQAAERRGATQAGGILSFLETEAA